MTERVGPYEIEAEIGRGAMGVVYRAIHSGLKRRCALKVIAPKRGAPAPLEGAVERFRREAQAAARLGKHPHVVQVFDVGEDAGRTFIAMELVEGKDLGRILAERGPLPEAEALDLTRKVAIALDHAHRNGVVHRDLKPSNVLVDAASGEPLLSDFGLALDLEARRLTGEGEVLGTPQYMAPEQALGRRDLIGPRTDVYSLGATLFDLLTGKTPFEGSVLGVITQIVLDEPPRLRRVNPACSPAVEAVVARALEKRPEDRYATALEMADDVGRARAGEPTRARPEGPLGRARRFARRHRRLVTVAAAALAVSLVAALALLVEAAKARARRAAAIARSLEALGEETLDGQVRAHAGAAALDPGWAFAHASLAEACYYRALDRYAGGDFAGYDADLRQALAAVERAIALGARGPSLRLSGTISEWLGDAPRAAAAYRRASAEDPDGANGLAALASAALVEGDMAGASLAATRAIEADAAGLAAEPSFVRSVARLASGDLEGALADAETAVLRLPSDDWYLAQRSRVRIARGELRAAAEDLLDVLRRYPASPVAQDALAALARREGDPERARRIEEAARARPRGRMPAYLASKDAPWAAPAAAPGSWAAPLARAEAALASGDAEAAIREASVALGLSPACARAHAIRAEAFRRLGRDADAALDARWAALLGGELR